MLAKQLVAACVREREKLNNILLRIANDRHRHTNPKLACGLLD
jgi:hypothetical protein